VFGPCVRACVRAAAAPDSAICQRLGCRLRAVVGGAAGRRPCTNSQLRRHPRAPWLAPLSHPAEMYPVPPARETQGLTDKYISSWLKDQKRDAIVLATKVCTRGAVCVCVCVQRAHHSSWCTAAAVLPPPPPPNRAAAGGLAAGGGRCGARRPLRPQPPHPLATHHTERLLLDIDACACTVDINVCACTTPRAPSRRWLATARTTRTCAARSRRRCA
jgi:hypothetical protein